MWSSVGWSRASPSSRWRGCAISALGLPDDILRTIGLVLLALIGVGLLIPALGHVLERPFARIPHARLRRRERVAARRGPRTGVRSLCRSHPGGDHGARGDRPVDGQLVLPTVSFAAALRCRCCSSRSPAPASVIASDVTEADPGRPCAGARWDLGCHLCGSGTGFGGTIAASHPGFLADIQERIEDNNATRDTLDQLRADAAADTDAQIPDYARAASDELGSARTFDQCAEAPDQLANCGPARSIVGIDEWFHARTAVVAPVARQGGAAGLLDLLCINRQRTIPHLRALRDRYAGAGLSVVGVHPGVPVREGGGERPRSGRGTGSDLPVALDNDYKTWTNYDQRYWPAHYLIDRQGVVRQVHYGEGVCRDGTVGANS